MAMQELLSRITRNSDVCFGKPVIRNMRYPVEMILELLSGEMSAENILTDYPDLEADDIKACMAYASEMVKVKSIHKIPAA